MSLPFTVHAVSPATGYRVRQLAAFADAVEANAYVAGLVLRLARLGAPIKYNYTISDGPHVIASITCATTEVNNG